MSDLLINNKIRGLCFCIKISCNQLSESLYCYVTRSDLFRICILLLYVVKHTAISFPQNVFSVDNVHLRKLISVRLQIFLGTKQMTDKRVRVLAK